MAFITKVVEFTQAYAYKAWVIKKTVKDRDGKMEKKTHLAGCKEETPGSRHRADNEKRKYKIISGFVLCWIALLILQGTHVGSNNGNFCSIWRSPPCGFYLPYVRNAMLRNVYQLMQRYIHFVNNNNKMATVLPGFDVLFKVRFPIDELMKGIWQCKVADKDVTIDKSMISFMGRAVSFVQYMPVKPIKHQLKVYTFFCAVSTIVLAYHIYIGKEDDIDNSDVAIWHRLCKQVGITGE